MKTKITFRLFKSEKKTAFLVLVILQGQGLMNNVKNIIRRCLNFVPSPALRETANIDIEALILGKDAAA